VNGIRLGGQGVVVSSSAFAFPAPAGEVSCSVEIWAEAGFMNSTGTLFGVYSPENLVSFSIRQYRQGLDIERKFFDPSGRAGRMHMVIEAFHPGWPSFIAVTASAQGSAGYVDGVLLERSARLGLFCRDLTGWLALGNSPRGHNNWPGTLRGLAIFNRELSVLEVQKHFHSWTETGRPELSGSEETAALYLFDERAGRVIHNRAGSAPDLTIPDHYLILRPEFLEAPWKEFKPTWGYLGDLLINIAGFIPFGFAFCAYFFSVRRLRRAAWLTILLGFMVSLTIETLQAYLPNRSSGMTDLITNTLGTAIGVMAFRSKFTQIIYSRVGIPSER
jgi:VanZ family protein